MGDSPRSVAVVDVNGDGISDLVTSNGFSDDISVLIGNGDGTYQTEQRFAVGDTPESITVIDLDGDGLPDVVTTISGFFSNEISVLFHQ